VICIQLFYWVSLIAQKWISNLYNVPAGGVSYKRRRWLKRGQSDRKRNFKKGEDQNTAKIGMDSHL